MKRIKQEQHIEIEEKSQQLKFRMQTEIQIDKHHALCQASDQLEELDYTKLYFAYSGIRKSQIEPRVLFKVLVCAYIYAKETRTEVREGRCGFRLWKSCHYRWLEENGQTAFIKPNNYESGQKHSFKAQIGRMENMGYYKPDDCFICKNGRHLDYVSKYTSHAKDGTEREISVYRCEDCSDCPYRSVCCKAKEENRRKEISVCWEFQKCASSLTGILPPKRENCFGATVPSRWKELSDSSSTTAASNASWPVGILRFWQNCSFWGFLRTLHISFPSATAAYRNSISSSQKPTWNSDFLKIEKADSSKDF